MSLTAVRTVIDESVVFDTATFARRTRNALAQAVLAEALTHGEPQPAEHEPPRAELEERVGHDLAEQLAAVYAGGSEWCSHAIEALQPLHDLTRA